MCSSIELSEAAKPAPAAQETLIWWALSELCVLPWLPAATSTAQRTTAASWHPSGSSSEHVSGHTDSPDTTDYHVSKSKAWLPVSKLNPAQHFLQVFSSCFTEGRCISTLQEQQRAAASGSGENVPAGGCGGRRAASPAGLRTYLSSSLKCCCLLNHCRNFSSGVMQ